MTANRKLAAAALLVLGALAPACDGPGGNADDCDYFMTAGMTEGQPVFLQTDVQCADSLAFPMTVTVDILGGPEPTPLDSFMPSRMEITYRNLRTGGTQVGVDVPRPYVFALPFQPAVPPAEFDYTGLNALTGQQKVEPPLSDAAFFAAGAVDLEATITIFGYPVNDPGRECTTFYRYQFAVVRGPGC